MIFAVICLAALALVADVCTRALFWAALVVATALGLTNNRKGGS